MRIPVFSCFFPSLTSSHQISFYYPLYYLFWVWLGFARHMSLKMLICILWCLQVLVMHPSTAQEMDWSLLVDKGFEQADPSRILKRKMWKSYKIFKNIVQHRTTSCNHSMTRIPASQIPRPGNVRYALQFTEGELCSADGVGFILSSDLPCTRTLDLEWVRMS